ncbi:MAG TPA: DNA-3-methyladenine glycosylase [Anaerovoracaceae bacterium]|nr:DNA-3-methyladenine glycosylase [Anaerovoracaceae bacterium]
MHFFKYGDKEIEHLKSKDKRMAQAIDKYGLIEREVIPDLFTALINSIVGQQISSKAADTVWNRLCLLLEEITPEAIASLHDDEIQKCGMSHRKVSYIRGAAESVLGGQLDIDSLKFLPDKEVIEKLTKLHGVGVWTAEMLMIFSMQRPDIVSWSDLAIRRGMSRLYNHKNLTKDQFRRYQKRYSPYGSVASLYLWAISAE